MIEINCFKIKEDRSLLIDCHTHVYLPSYMKMLRERTEIPLIHTLEDGSERILLLKEEVEEGKDRSKGGRPVGPQFYDRQFKLDFMDLHDIDVSIVSLANPWLDFLSPSLAFSLAKTLNEDINTYCSTLPPSVSKESTPTHNPIKPNTFVPLTNHRLYAFGSLPLVPGITIEEIKVIVEQLKGLSHVRGVVMGTKGLGKGLDSEEMEEVWKLLEESGLVCFVHPHYGIQNAWGELDNGHVLPLAMGFPFETSIAIARLILAGVLDRYPALKLFLAHSAGALPALSSRLASCIIHDPLIKDRLKHDFRYYLGLMYYDSVTYGAEELECLERTVARSEGWKETVGEETERGRLLAPRGDYRGTGRILFGTDHPFFPPLNGETRWTSVDENLHAVKGAFGWTNQDRKNVLGNNAVKLFNLDLEL